MLDKEWSCRAIPKPSPFWLHGPFLRSLVSRNYWPAVEKCGFTLVPSMAMKEVGASTSTCTFILGEELPLTPAVWHKSPGAWQEAQPLSQPPSLPPSLSWGKGNKSRDSLSPLLQYPCQGQGGGYEQSSFTSLPLSHLGCAMCAVLSPLWQERFALGLQIWSLTAIIHGLSPLTFYFFWPLSSKILRPLTCQIPKYLWSSGLQCWSLLS